MSAPGDALDVLCITAEGGTLGLPAAEVIAVREDEELPSLDVGVRVLDLAPLVGPGAPGAILRRIRIAPLSGPAVDLVTRGALKVRSVQWSALHAVPAWLRPLVAQVGAQALVLEGDALVLLADTAELARMGMPSAQVRAASAGPAASNGGAT